jgi:hypothetical protein
MPARKQEMKLYMTSREKEGVSKVNIFLNVLTSSKQGQDL